MLTQIDVVCDTPFYMSVLGANPRDSLIIQSITGLGPPDISLFVGDYARDGGVYTGRRATTRNPVLTISLNPNYSLGETTAGLRELLYRAFVEPTVNGDDVTLLLHDDIRPNRVLTGYTEKFEGEVFSQDTAVQISMICPDPFIRDAVSTVIEGDYQQFPFSYAGTAETGFEVDISLTVSSSVLALDNNGATMVLSYPFLAGDQVHINTIPGQRQITLTRSSEPQPLDILYTLSSDSPWLSLHSQANTLQVYGLGSENVVASIRKLEFTNAYWGV